MTLKDDVQRTGGVAIHRGKFYAKVRVGAGKRPEFPMPAVTDRKTAEIRSGQIAEVADLLIRARRAHDIKEWAANIGSATTEKQVRIFTTAAQRISDEAVTTPEYGTITFQALAGRWTTGQLHIDHPDHVAKKQHAGDINILNNRILKFIGPIPFGALVLEDFDRVMRALPSPPEISSGYRRAVAQVMHRLCALAVYPCKIIKASPLPKGWLPKIGKPKAKSALYPKEEALLLGNTESDLDTRLFVGFLNREGCRKTEARLIAWPDLDLENGTVTLDENKTDDPRSWAMGTDVIRALVKWKKARGGKGPFDRVPVGHLGEWIREQFPKVGITRAQLTTQSDKRMHFRAHDTRSTFITLALASGQTESWIMRRTAHKSSTMIARYTAAAATATDIGLGWLLPLDEILPELAGPYPKCQTLDVNARKRAGADRGRAKQLAKRAARTKRLAAAAAKGGGTVGEQTSVRRSAAPSRGARKNKSSSPSRTRTGTPSRAGDFKFVGDVSVDTSTGGALRSGVGEQVGEQTLVSAPAAVAKKVAIGRKNKSSSPSGTRTRTHFRARDFKSPAYAIPPRGHLVDLTTDAAAGDR